jgi:hypothetical protein
MRLPDQPFLLLEQCQLRRRRGGVVDLAQQGEVLYEWLALWPFLRLFTRVKRGGGERRDM